MIQAALQIVIIHNCAATQCLVDPDTGTMCSEGPHILT